MGKLGTVIMMFVINITIASTLPPITPDRVPMTKAIVQVKKPVSNATNNTFLEPWTKEARYPFPDSPFPANAVPKAVSVCSENLVKYLVLQSSVLWCLAEKRKTISLVPKWLFYFSILLQKSFLDHLQSLY